MADDDYNNIFNRKYGDRFGNFYNSENFRTISNNLDNLNDYEVIDELSEFYEDNDLICYVREVKGASKKDITAEYNFLDNKLVIKVNDRVITEEIKKDLALKIDEESKPKMILINGILTIKLKKKM